MVVVVVVIVAVVAVAWWWVEAAVLAALTVGVSAGSGCSGNVQFQYNRI